MDWLRQLPEHWKFVSIRHEFENLDYKRVPLAGIDRAEMEKTFPYYGASGVIDEVTADHHADAITTGDATARRDTHS